jgi:hypothetical protein
MKNMIINLLLLFLSSAVFSCNSSARSTETESQMQDSLKRPSGVSRKATLINLGAEDMPVYQWVEYVGKFNYRNKSHSHIYGFKYFDAKGNVLSTVYYENMQIRSGRKDFDVTNYKVLPYPGDATIEVTNGIDTLLFFHVLESDEFKRTYNGVEYVRMPATYYEADYDIGFTSDEDVEFNVMKEKDIYTVTFTHTTPVAFKLCSACKTEPSKVSFLNEQEGRIYFVEKECYLELVNSEDIQKILALRR